MRHEGISILGYFYITFIDLLLTTKATYAQSLLIYFLKLCFLRSICNTVTYSMEMVSTSQESL